MCCSTLRRPHRVPSIVNVYHMCQRRKNGATALDVATDDTCRDILTHHKAICASINEDPTKLVTAACSHCGTLSAGREQLPATALSLGAHHFDPAFLWAPPDARAAVFAWALHVFIAQLAATIQPFEDLPDDCAGDVLEFFEMAMTRTDALHIAKHCSSPEARAWVRTVIAAAVVVGALCSYNKECTVSVASRILQTLILYSPLWFFPLSLRKRQRLIWCQQLKKATWKPYRIAFQRRPTLRLKGCVAGLLVI